MRSAKGCPYRKENPLHRLYYHEICPPEKIVYQMRKLGEWLESSEYTSLHPVVAGTRLQLKLLRAYPWTKNTGKVARLLTNYVLLRAEYLPAIIHSIDRQRYYEVLRHDNDGLLGLVVESLENGIDTTTKFFDELGGLKARRPARCEADRSHAFVMETLGGLPAKRGRSPATSYAAVGEGWQASHASASTFLGLAAVGVKSAVGGQRATLAPGAG